MAAGADFLRCFVCMMRLGGVPVGPSFSDATNLTTVEAQMRIPTAFLYVIWNW